MSYRFLLILAVITVVLLYTSFKASVHPPEVQKVKADQAQINISMNPKTGNVATDPQNITLILQPADAANSISGINLVLNTSGTLKILDVSNPATFPDDESSVFSQITKDISADRARLSYVITLPDEELPKAVKIRVTVAGYAAGVGSLYIDQDALQIVGRVPGYTYAVNNIDSAEFIFTENISLQNIQNTQNTQTGQKSLTVRVRMQGVADRPLNPDAKVDIKTTLTHASAGHSYEYVIPVIPVGEGIWSGNVPIDAPVGTSYTAHLKGALHIQKKASGQISIADRENMLDLSTLTLMAGDIHGENNKQDGVIDTLDIIHIRNHFGSTDMLALKTADLNFDGIVDTQDYSVLISSIPYKFDEN